MHFDPFKNHAEKKPGAVAADPELEPDDERLDAPRVLVLRDSFVGLGISWSRTVCFRLEVQLRLPFVLLSVGIGNPAVVRLGKPAREPAAPTTPESTGAN